MSTLGGAIAAAGGALLILFGYLRGHAEKFREENRQRADALRSRLANDLFLEFITKFVPPIDQILKRSAALAAIRRQLIDVMSRNEPVDQVLKNLRQAVDESPPTAEESKQIKELAAQLLKKFETSDEISKAYQEGWEEESKAAALVLRFSITSIGLGLVVIAIAVGLSANPDPTTGSWIAGGAILALFLGLLLVTTSLDAHSRYQLASVAQRKFLDAVNQDLYSVPENSTRSD